MSQPDRYQHRYKRLHLCKAFRLSYFPWPCPKYTNWFLLLLWVYCPTFRKEPTGQVCGAQMLLAQGEKELILVALLNEMVMSCSLEDSFVLD